MPPKVHQNPVIQLIAVGNAIAKVISSTVSDWDFLLNQIIDPNANRPEDLTGLGEDGRRYNPLTRETYNKDQSNKGPHTHTKKTAASLLNKEVTDGKNTKNAGRMFLFGTTQDYGIGLVFDVNQCDRKNDKYFFLEEAVTFQKWWKNLDEEGKPVNRERTYQSYSLEEAKQKLAEKSLAQDKPLHYSENMVGVNRAALKAVFFQTRTHGKAKAETKEYMLGLFDAIRKRIYTENKLGLPKNSLPIVILNADEGVTDKSIYTLAQQRKDLAEYKAEFGADDIQDLLDELDQSQAALPPVQNNNNNQEMDSVQISQVLNGLDVFHPYREVEADHVFTASYQQVQLIQQLLKIDGAHLTENKKQTRDYLIKNLQNKELNKFFRLMAVYTDCSHNYKTLKSFKARRAMVNAKQELNIFMDKIEHHSGFSCDYMRAYYQYSVNHDLDACKNLLIPYMQLQGNAENKNASTLAYDFYAGFLPPVNDQIIIEGAARNSPNCIVRLLENDLSKLTENILQLVHASANKKNIVSLNNVIENLIARLIATENIEGLKNAVLIGNEKASLLVSQLAQALLALYQQHHKDNIEINKTYTSILDFIELISPKLAKKFDNLNEEWVDSFKDQISNFHNQVYNRVGDLVRQVKTEDQYENKLFKLKFELETLSKREVLTHNQVIAPMLSRLEEHLRNAIEDRLDLGVTVISEEQLNEIEESLRFYQVVAGLQNQLNILNPYKAEITENSSRADITFKSVLENTQDTLSKLVDAVSEKQQNRDPQKSLTSSLTNINQFVIQLNDQLIKEKDKLFRRKLDNIKSILEKHSFDLHGIMHDQILGRSVSTSAKKVYDILDDALCFKGCITGKVYAEIAEEIIKVLKDKTKATSGFLFFTLGVREESTAKLYRNILEYLKHPIPEDQIANVSVIRPAVNG